MNRKVSDERIREAHAVYMENREMSQTKAAELVGLDCSAFRKRVKRLGLEIKPNGWVKQGPAKRFGENHPSWKGGRHITEHGYVKIRITPNDPMWCMADKNSVVFEHRYVMAQYLGRPLTKNETVHHIDGNRQHNDITNLQLRIGNHGKGQAYECMNCGSDRLQPKEIAA